MLIVKLSNRWFVHDTDGANSFAWNTDSDEGANAWDLGEDLKEDPNADDYYVIQEKAGETSESEVPANSEPKETGEELPKEEL